MALTERGKQALTSITQQFNPCEKFTAKDTNFHSAVLTALVKQNYLQKVEGSSPGIYFYNGENLTAFKETVADFPPFEPYSIQEYTKQKIMSYQELVNYLLTKYGRVRYNYFVTESMKTKTKENGRGKEGLYIHHIYEKYFVDLSKPSIFNKWEYQLASNLIYCNIYEHMLLHMKICEEWKKEEALDLHQLVGLGGVLNHIAPTIYTKGESNVNTIFLQDFPIVNELESFQKRLRESEYYGFFEDCIRPYGDFVEYVSNLEARREAQERAFQILLDSLCE